MSRSGVPVLGEDAFPGMSTPPTEQEFEAQSSADAQAGVDRFVKPAAEIGAGVVVVGGIVTVGAGYGLWRLFKHYSKKGRR